MRLCTFRLRGEGSERSRVGSVSGRRITELEEHVSMSEFIERKGRVGVAGEVHDVEEAVLQAPLRPGKIIAAIVNTRGMLGGKDVKPDRPRLDMKAPSCVVGPGEAVIGTESGIRPEVELAAVVGRRLTHSSVREAREAIFGYTVLNDVTAPSESREDAYEAYRRDSSTGRLTKVTLRGPLFRSKNHDTFCPMGPWIVTRDELEDTSDLRMESRFDGVKVQDGSTADYIFSPEQIASYVSSFLTLEPGDVISCGSVGWTERAVGRLDPSEFVLPRSDGMMELKIEGIGRLLNPVRYGGATWGTRSSRGAS